MQAFLRYVLFIGLLWQTAVQAETLGENPWAVNIFLHAEHFHKNAQLNEQNFGMGMKYYIPDTWFSSGGEFFVEAGGLRNSHQGMATFAGAGYTRELFEIKDVHFSGSVAVASIRYEAAGKVAVGNVVIPFVSASYGWCKVNAVYFPRHDGGFILFSVEKRF